MKEGVFFFVCFCLFFCNVLTLFSLPSDKSVARSRYWNTCICSFIFLFLLIHLVSSSLSFSSLSSSYTFLSRLSLFFYFSVFVRPSRLFFLVLLILALLLLLLPFPSLLPPLVSQDTDINLTRCLRTNVNLSEMRKGSMRERKLFIKKFSQLDNFYLFSGEV